MPLTHHGVGLDIVAVPDAVGKLGATSMLTCTGGGLPGVARGSRRTRGSTRAKLGAVWYHDATQVERPQLGP